ncbi:MAG TPA: tRNA (N(6)-L-threonylcarbamoyladenosine(37)-C(2))-methylthiotransferase MtaB [Bryobacteraceae bacterium]|nr:tRNA (N(6)-L-threonylcarbamoyladenosine(37)-C(2))-methylthiotransferase MtaB [Bryobacteraceae bacterium]
MAKFHVRNFGCRSSQADGAAIEAQLTASGYSSVGEYRSAELVVLNTCTVTATADDELRQIVRRVNRENPEARIVVTGCYAQRAPEEIAHLPGVSLVVGNSHKNRIADLLSAPYHGEVHVGDIFEPVELEPAALYGAPGDRSRPNLKIQDGCPNRCTFCIIPSVRGRSRSARPAAVLEQVRHLSSRYPEIVLTGINLGRWGREPGMNLRRAELVRMLLAETDVRRIRLSSVEPMDWTDDLLQLMASSDRIARHVHAPLQSGSDTVLRRMRRKYRPQHYEHRILLAKELMPDCAIGADVMVGFPGETEAEFRQTVSMIQRLPFTYLHIVPYSERPGTPAADAAGQVPVAARKERGRVLKSIASEKNHRFRASMQGRTLSAVTLGNAQALTSNYINVELAVPRPACQLVNLEIGALTSDGAKERTMLPVLAS